MIRFEPRAGESIERVARLMCALARTADEHLQDESVVASFQGIRIVATATSDPLQLEEEYTRARSETERPTVGWLAEVAHRLRTQDNQVTAHPIFTVQQRRRIYGLDPAYSERVVWVDSDGEADGEKSAELERDFEQTGKERDGYTRTAYVDIWQFVTACLTEQGCKDYLALNGHNLREPRIYVESGCRNVEWQKLRTLLADPSCVAAGGKEPR
jgi:hypothetical protein